MKGEIFVGNYSEAFLTVRAGTNVMPQDIFRVHDVAEGGRVIITQVNRNENPIACTIYTREGDTSFRITSARFS